MHNSRQDILLTLSIIGKNSAAGWNRLTSLPCIDPKKKAELQKETHSMHV